MGTNNKDAELERVKQIVQEHYETNDGQLTFWGEIQRYLYVFGADQKLAILPDGKVLSAIDDQLQKATLTIKGKDLSPLFATKTSDQSPS